MRVILFVLILICLFSCTITKQNIDSNNIEINNGVIKNNLINDSLFIIDSDREGDSVLFSNVDTIVNSIVANQLVRKNIEEQEHIKEIQRLKKTNLKIVDATNKKEGDTTSGWIAYSVPEEMRVEKKYSVKVRISKKSNGQTKSNLILGSSDAINNPSLPTVATIEDVKVLGEMSAELRADSESFDIKALSTPVQNIDNESYTEWEWVVTPEQSGDSPLKLIIRVKELNKDIVVFNKNIKIKKNTTIAVSGFFEKYWQWFMTTIIIPVIIYFWNRKKKKRQKKELE